MMELNGIPICISEETQVSEVDFLVYCHQTYCNQKLSAGKLHLPVKQ